MTPTPTPTDALAAHATDAPADPRIVRYGAPSTLDDRFTVTAPGLPEPLAALDWRTLATFTAHAGAIVETARERFDRCAADGVDGGTFTDHVRAVVELVATRADREARAVHSWWHGKRTRGDDAPHAPAPDPYTRVRAQTVTERSNRGVTVQRVTVHGRAMVGGDVHAQRSPALTMTPDRLAYAIETAPRTALGHTDALALAQLTDVAYPDIPRLIGGDVLTFHEWRTAGVVRTGKPRPQRFATRYRLRTPTPRVGEPGVTGWGALLAPADTTVKRTTIRGTVKRDERGRIVERTPDRLIVERRPATHAWRGHRLTVRPPTVRDQRAADARPVTDAVIVRDTDALGGVLANVASGAEPGARVAWRWRGLEGYLTVTAGKRRRLSVSGLPGDVKGYSTPDALARRVDALTA